jgi:hypothetical protein
MEVDMETGEVGVSCWAGRRRGAVTVYLTFGDGRPPFPAVFNKACVGINKKVIFLVL